MLPGGGLVEDEEGVLWREEKNKVGQGGGGIGGVEVLETYIQPGQKRSLEEEGERTGGENVGEERMTLAPSFFFDKEEEEKGGEIAKRAWNSYFTGGFGKRGGNNAEKWGKAKVLAGIRPAVFVRPLRSLPGAFSLFDTALNAFSLFALNVTLPLILMC